MANQEGGSEESDMAANNAGSARGKVSSETSSGSQGDFWDAYLKVFLSAVPPLSQETVSSAELALKSLGELAKSVPGQVSDAFRMLVEFLQELTNIKGVEVQVQSWRTLHVRLNTVREAEIPVNKDLAGMGKVEAVKISKQLHFQVGIGEGNKDLFLHVHDGLTLVLSIAFFSSKQYIPLKGIAKIVRDETGQLVVESKTTLPGTNLPITVSFPLKRIFAELRKQL